ncbi:MAG TPA: FAD-dependent oxidoreductase [Microthrixaceae bacterium]|nr:FAD-dependent oxidoreductase [Microthrixaceae bacterium]HNJ70119.1 FAD-dependent oxidoreductase [Microthrixaceae bacterium]
MADFDAIVVGAGPAGSAAAIELARSGASVCLIERGPYPGSKNMYGGVIYGRILDEIIPEWWTEAPVQRWVTRRATMILTEDRALTVDYRSGAWGEPPYNGATAYRPDFDAWLAEHAVAAGATLVTSTTVTGLLRDGDRADGAIVGVRTDRPDGDLTARVVIACDGVNSFVAKEAGLYGEVDAANYTLGVKETIALPREVIDERFGVRGDHGVDYEIMGCTGDVPGGGFIYTNADTLAVGLVLSLPALARGGVRPEELLRRMKAHPAIAPLVEGGEVTEYSAHVIPEAGFDMMPSMIADGLLVAGDAAAMCLAAGIWLEGVNFAIGSGSAAGKAAARAIRRADTTAAGLDSYRTRIEASFVMKDHRKLRQAPHLVMGELAQQKLPALACGVAEAMFHVDNPHPKPGLRRIVARQMKANGVRWRDAVSEGFRAWRTFG